MPAHVTLLFPFVAPDELVRRFPAHPPYGGAFEHVVPHLTLADQLASAMLGAVARSVTADLPIDATAREARLMVERDAGWVTHTRFMFAGPG